MNEWLNGLQFTLIRVFTDKFNEKKKVVYSEEILISTALVNITVFCNSLIQYINKLINR